MAETTYNVERDLEEARDMANGLEDYVRGDSVYGSVGGMFAGDQSLPSLTIGNLLLRLRRLNALASLLSADQKAAFDAAKVEHDRVRKEWTVHYTQKASDEVHARLRSLSTFVGECEDAPEACADAYLPEALRRTVVQEIVDAVPEAAQRDDLSKSDSALRGLTESRDFLWDAALANIYPQSKFWWLYAQPTGEAREEA